MQPDKMSLRPLLSEPCPQTKLSGKEFEDIVMERLRKLHKSHVAHITRYGTIASRMKGADGKMVTMAKPSLPDFEGLYQGRQMIFDAKVCSQLRFDLNKFSPYTKGPRRRQLTHMYDRSEYGAACFFLLHWNATSKGGAETWAVPVHRHHSFWSLFERGELYSIRRDSIRLLGVPVRWNKDKREKTLRPDMEGLFRQLCASA